VNTNATVVKLEVEPGWEIFDTHVKTGDRYLLDLARVEKRIMCNLDTGRETEVEAVYVLGPNGTGWLPLLAFKLDES